MDSGRYFDHAATTPMYPEVLAAVHRVMEEEIGNPGSLHQAGLRAKEIVEESRSVIARAIGARDREIVFTASGTEANNLALFGAARRRARKGEGRHILVGAVEHPSVLRVADRLVREGFEVERLPVDRHGRVDPAEVGRRLRQDTILVSLMHANNVVGSIQPVEIIGEMAQERGVLFHVDAVQSFGKIPVDVRRIRADLLTLDAHKMGGPKGVAALYVHKGTRLDPILFGGGQERQLRPGTPNVPAIAGFGKAVELMERYALGERGAALRKRLTEHIRRSIPECVVFGHPEESLPTILTIGIPKVEGQLLMLELDRRGFAVSSGSACSASESEPSYVLLAMGYSRDEALESLRISLGWTNTESSVDELGEALSEIAAEMRSAALSIRGK
ncbi:MAG: cysteine desulfurase [Kyrpidia tusciae]|nr:cysteine desulfurase family protein [Kyrpidia tusciae]MBE3553011.1 cysteine desulfurase [Kyrpidia tusciae]